MSGSRVLLVDDDEAVLNSLRRALALGGYEVRVAADGATALSLAEDEMPDLVVLDVMLPDVSGFEVCRLLRLASAVPILLLTARDTVPDRVKGLDLGADDYLVKPFSLDELLARVRALLRRAGHGGQEVLVCGLLRLDIGTREAYRAGRPLALTAQQYNLLAALMRHPRQVLSREQLCGMVWGDTFAGESNFVDAAVMELRRKLEAGGHERVVHTVRGFGYVLREG
ncbi:MAG: response regulator transcription factor [Chloroflexota bacterium]